MRRDPHGNERGTGNNHALAPEVALDVRVPDRTLGDLFHDKAVFVHMGATMTKDDEIEVIRSGQIHYKDIDIQETSVRLIGTTTAILLNKIRLVAIVGGNEVTNPFVVTEVYVDESGTWTLAALSFTRLLTP